MSGYILNTDTSWYKNITTSAITNPVFWFRRQENPAPAFLQPGALIFIRPTKQKETPHITAFGTFIEGDVYNVDVAFETFGRRMGFSSIIEMISSSDSWTGNKQITNDSSIFCFSIDNLEIIDPLYLTELQRIGIDYDYKHIVTGKGLNRTQVELIINAAKEENNISTLKAENVRFFENVSKEVRLRTIVRYQDIVRQQKEKYHNKCQIANCQFTFLKKDGTYYCEAHHIIALSDGGSQDPENLVILCPNHHRMMHFADVEINRDDDKRVISFSINHDIHQVIW